MFTLYAVVRLVEHTAKFSETTSEVNYGTKMNIQYTDKSSLEDISVSRLITRSSCDKTARFRAASCCLQPKAHLYNKHTSAS